MHFDSVMQSNDSKLLATVAEALYQQNDFAKSTMFWEKAGQLSPVASNMVGLYKTEKRLGIHREDHFLSQDSLALLEAFGRYFCEIGKWNQAYRFYQKACGINPGNLPLLVKFYETALRTNQPFDSNLFLGLNDRNEYDKAMFFLHNALAYNSNRTTQEQQILVYEDLLKIYETARKRDSAFFSTAQRLFLTATWCTNLADYYTQRGDLHRAMLNLDNAIHYYPDWWVIYTMRGQLLLRMNRFDEAKELYMKKAPDVYDPNKGLPKYRDRFLLDLKQLETNGTLNPTQLNEVAKIKVLLKDMP
jgi:tetratricopeptide (TPR) repeat protein